MSLLPEWLQILLVLGTPIFAAVGSFVAVRVTLQYHEARLTKCETRLDKHDDRFLQLAEKL